MESRPYILGLDPGMVPDLELGRRAGLKRKTERRQVMAAKKKAKKKATKKKAKK